MDEPTTSVTLAAAPRGPTWRWPVRLGNWAGQYRWLRWLTRVLWWLFPAAPWIEGAEIQVNGITYTVVAYDPDTLVATIDRPWGTP